MMRVPSGFIDIPDANLAAHQIITDDDLVKISENANFAVVRTESIFMGYFKNGDTIPPPVSPIDGYQYLPGEVLFDWTLYSTRGTDMNFTTGQAEAPTINYGLSSSQPANLYYFTADVDDSTGNVSIMIDYFSQGAKGETQQNDGVLKVYAICQRASVNSTSGVP